MNSTTIGSWLSRIGGVVASYGQRFDGTPGDVVKGLGAAAQLVGDLLLIGRVPARHIEVVGDADPALRAIREERQRAADARLKGG